VSGLLLLGVCGISGNNVEFCDDMLQSLAFFWWEYVGLVAMMWSFVMRDFRDLSFVCGSTWD